MDKTEDDYETERILNKTRLGLLEQCDILRMLLESPNREKHELDIIKFKASINASLREIEYNMKIWQEMNDNFAVNFIKETIELIKKEKEKWKD